MIDGSSENLAHVWSKLGLLKKYFKFEAYVDVNNCFEQIEVPKSLQARISSKLPSYLL